MILYEKPEKLDISKFSKIERISPEIKVTEDFGLREFNDILQANRWVCAIVVFPSQEALLFL